MNEPTEQERQMMIGVAAWHAVHDHGAFRRDFPDDDYFRDVGETVLREIGTMDARGQNATTWTTNATRADT